MDKIIDELNNDPVTTISNMTIPKLVKIIKYAADKYYNEQPVISDQIYDLLIDAIKDKDPTNPVLKQIGAKVTTNKVKLPYFMGSMDKIKPGSPVLEKWLKKYSGPYIVSDKLDGVSGLFHIDSKNNQHLYTRGNGLIGTDITHLIKYIHSLNISDLPKNIAVRGEFIISKKNFKKYSGTMSNARNMVAGLINSKTIEVDKMNDVDFVVYELINPSNIKQSEQFIRLQLSGFKVVHYDIFDKFDETVLSKQLEIRRKNSLYEIDGIIVTGDQPHARNLSGNPDYAFAFKETTQVINSEVIEVEWNISKDGLFKPTIIIKPVNLSGVTVKRATAFNAKFVNDNKLGPGAIVKITRSGDVIPYIMEVIKPAKEAQMPKVGYKWNETKVDIYYDTDIKNDQTEKEILIKNLAYFFEKLDIKHVASSTVEKMVEAGFDTIPKILKASKDDFLVLKGFKDKSSENIYNSIHERIKSVELVDLMVASNIFGHGLGSKKIELILKVYPNIMDHPVKKEAITEINGFDILTATRFVDGLPEFKNFVKTVPMINIVNKYIGGIKKEGVFKDEKVVFTGFRNKTWNEYIENNGGEVVNSVSKNTTLLVVADENDTSSKLNKAKELGVKIMTADEFKKKYKL